MSQTAAMRRQMTAKWGCKEEIMAKGIESLSIDFAVLSDENRQQMNTGRRSRQEDSELPDHDSGRRMG
jgi:hypothetical protein